MATFMDMARPKIADDERKDKPLRIRLNVAQRAAIDKAASQAGYESSTWARIVLLEAANSRKQKK